MSTAPNQTLLLSRTRVERLLTPARCIAAVEDAFRRHALGEVPAPGILGMHEGEGSFHIKAGFLDADRPYFAAKINANFPRNGISYGLPTIQGAVVLFDAKNGVPLAVMDSMAITALRTAAATAVAAKHLSRRDSATALICGCGGQAAAQVRALLRVRNPARIWAYDLDATKAAAFASALGKEFGHSVVPAADLAKAVYESDIVITCTTAKRYFIERQMVRTGTFVAGVGADNEDKQELDPQLLANTKLVTDLTAQCIEIGDLHHAVDAGAMSKSGVHAELGEVVAGLRPGRENDAEIIVFDSTGTALQDVAAAIAVYQGALAHGEGVAFTFAS